MIQRLVLAILSIASSGRSAGATNHLSGDDLNKLFSRAGVYVGDLHGTEESPAFIRSLVERSIEMKFPKRIIVSLELPESATKHDSAFWNWKDGRTSRAMWQLIQALSQLSKENKITLHFQYMDLWPVGSPVDADEKIASRINDALSEGFVITYGGNLHNARKYPYTTDKKSARMLIGDKIISLRLAAFGGGQAWVCTGQPIECGVKDISKKMDENISINSLYEDLSKFHEYVLYLEKFTASLPLSSLTVASLGDVTGFISGGFFKPRR